MKVKSLGWVLGVATSLSPCFVLAQGQPAPMNFTLGLDALALLQAAPDSPRPSRFEFQEADLSFSGTVDPTWSFFSNLVFVDGEVDPEEVFGATNAIPDLQVRVGKGYVSFGKHGLLRTYAYPFIREPLAIENSLGDDGLKATGVEATWTTPLPWDCELLLGGYQAIGPSAECPLDLGSNAYDNIPYLGHLKNLFEIDDNTSLEIGASGLNGMGADGLHHFVGGADLTLKGLPPRDSNAVGWILQGEYLQRMSYSGGFTGYDSEGWYGSLQFRWAASWWTGLRLEEVFDGMTEDLEEDGSGLIPGHLQRACLNVAWVPSESSFVRAEYDLTRRDDGSGGYLMDHRVLVQMNWNIGFKTSHAAKTK
jgi:hypothetical protein